MSDLENWLNNTGEDADLARELSAIRDDAAALRDRFYRSLSFGTGGMRGEIGAGTNRMNVYTVAAATQGLAAYMLRQGLPPKAAIAYDTRLKSDVFAMTAARVFAANGITALLFDAPAPTPALSFSVRHYGCGAGVCVTASHNPAKYNGYKVYGADGCQITDGAARLIQGEIDGVDMFGGVSLMDAHEAVEKGLIVYIGAETSEAFLQAVLALRVTDAPCAPLNVVYTPLNGAGLRYVTKALDTIGAEVAVVPEQEKPDPAFTTCPYPNPEEPAALKLGLNLCRGTKADILLATDPDCDRVGVAAFDGVDYKLLSGNETGVLLLDYICRKRLENGTMPKTPVAVKTIVTTEMAAAVAKKHGVQLIDVLTGFKYIGEQIGLLEANGGAARYVFGFEESYGYLSGAHARDKDAVNAAVLICDMAADYKREGLSLAAALERLYAEYGFYLNRLDNFAFAGEAGFAQMQSIMRGLRENPPKRIGGFAVASYTDYLNSAETGLPPSDVLRFVLPCGTVTVRPSGTEPKMKAYYSVNAPDKTDAERIMAALRADVSERHIRPSNSSR